MNVAEVASKLAGTGAERPEAALLLVGFGLTFSTDVATRGTTTTAAATAAATAADTATCRYRRRRTRRLIRPNVPGGGGSGSIRSCSQRSRSSWPWSSIGLPHAGLEPVPGLEQVGLDRALRAPQQGGHLAHAEPGVVVQQERVAHPRGQILDEVPHVDVLRRVGHRIRGGRRGDRA